MGKVSGLVRFSRCLNPGNCITNVIKNFVGLVTPTRGSDDLSYDTVIQRAFRYKRDACGTNNIVNRLREFFKAVYLV